MNATEYICERVPMTEETAKRLTTAFLAYINSECYQDSEAKHAIQDIFDDLTGKEAAEVVRLMRKEN